MIAREDARAGCSERNARQGDMLRRDIQRVERARLRAAAVYVVAGPRGNARTFGNGNALLDLQPAKDDMQVWRVPHIAIGAAAAFDLLEPAIKEKNIAFSHMLVLEMPFRRASLPKDSPPARQPGNARAIEIGIEMRRSIRPVAVACQIMHKFTG